MIRSYLKLECPCAFSCKNSASRVQFLITDEKPKANQYGNQPSRRERESGGGGGERSMAKRVTLLPSGSRP